MKRRVDGRPSSRFGEATLCEGKHIFDFLDSDGDGFLSESQVRVAMMCFGIPDTPDLVRACERASTSPAGVSFGALMATLEAHTATNPLSESSIADLLKVSTTPTFPERPSWLTTLQVRSILTGCPTTRASQLVPLDVSAIFDSLSVAEGERVDFMELMRVMSGGYRGWKASDKRDT